MDVLSFLMTGFEVALQPQNLLIAFIGAFVGTIVGLLPGLGPINGVAILLPFAYALGLPVESALILLAAVYLGCEYGGRISAILINVPGDAGAIMTTMDGYPLAQQGKAGIALSLSSVSSFIGSMVAFIGIVFCTDFSELGDCIWASRILCFDGFCDCVSNWFGEHSAL